MALVAAKCPTCGANLEVDATKEAAVCPFCNTAYITQKAIINYSTTIVNNNTINANTVNIVSGNFKNLMTKAKDSFAAHDIQDAYNSVAKALELNPKHIEALLLKSIYAGYLQNTLDIAYKTYSTVFSKYVLKQESTNFMHHYLNCYLQLIMSLHANDLENYAKNVDLDDNLDIFFTKNEQTIKNFDLAVALYTKLYDFDKKCESDYVKTLKLFCQVLAKCSEKFDYLYMIDNNGEHYKQEASPQKDKYLSLKKNYESIILKFDPQYKKVKVERHVNINGGTIFGLVLLGIAVIAIIIVLAKYL